MPTAKKNPAVDAYIEKSPDYARPILIKIRKLIHQACPEVTEAMKWSTPFFDYKGPIIGVPAFKQHINLVFWKGKLLKDSAGILAGGDAAMGGSSLKLTSVKDLPADKILLAYFAEAVALNEQGIKLPAKKKTPKKSLAMPTDLQSALRRNKAARTSFEAMSPSHQREYIAWIIDAKQEATRERRIAKAVEQLTEGKSLNWKYERKK